MRKNPFILLVFIMALASHAQTPTDSTLWVKMMFAYVDALKADIQYKKDLQFNKVIENWKLPLKSIFNKENIGETKKNIEIFLGDSLADCTESQREKARSVIKMLDTYETEAERMIAAFKMTDPQMLDNLKYCNTATNVHTFSLMYLRKWFDQSKLTTFSQSAIPYLVQLSNELKNMVDSLCLQETATPELLQKLLDTEYRISTSHTKKEVEK